jgi:poly(hydroxyalkanoate) depolymerase family esterase
MEAAMNIRFSALFDRGSRRNMASTSAARAKTPERPVDREFDRCSRSDRAALGTMRSGRRLATVCRNLGLGFCVLSSFLLGGSQAFAAPVEVTNFGTNPGHLRMFKYVPSGLPASSPLVVVLHGCTQNARDYAAQSGWIELADRLNLALAVPEQSQSNNPRSCFNWFVVGHNRRGQGEALSIKQMVDKMKADHGIDPGRVFVTGLSAGGAMTSVMLATYPEVFAGGGIVAGLPYGCANDPTPFMATQALQCMSSGHPASLPGLSGLPGMSTGFSPFMFPLPPGVCQLFPLPGCPSDTSAANGFTASELGDFVRQASSHNGPFPKVSIWHGSSDPTVSPVNASEEMLQWTNVHGVKAEPAVSDTVNGFPHHVFKDAAGKAVVETFSITGMGHGDPVDPGTGPSQCGTAAPFMLDTNICASMFIAKFWGLAP